MRMWLLGIVLTALAGELARQVAPQGKEQAMVRLAGGLLLALAILRPLAGQDWEALELGKDMPDFQAEAQAEIYRKNQQNTLSAIIEEKTEAYIWDKASQLGLACRAEVTTAEGAGGIPFPNGAVLHGPYNQELARYIQEEVGIPAEKLIWLEDEEWQERKENES